MKNIKDMTEKELALERFVAHGKDKLIQESQCKECANNNIFDCKVFGEFPEEYKMANINKECPEKIKIN